MIHFMNCNSCQHLVEVNCTGICLGCQMGFAGPQSDSWKNFQEPKQETKGVLDHAIEETKQKENTGSADKSGDSSGKGPEGSVGERPKRRRQAQKKIQAPEV